MTSTPTATWDDETVAADRTEHAVHRIAIIGGGASGVLTAFQLLGEHGDPSSRITVHEASGRLGYGIAYGTSDPRHLLNVRARHMSAYHDIPSDFIEWARRTGLDPDPLGFLPRIAFADYLQDTLAGVADHRLTIRAGRVESISRGAGGGFELRTGDRISRADSVVLAYGNATPQDLEVDGVAVSSLPGHLGNPWDLAALRALAPDAQVVILGTGLTAIDTAITLLDDEPGRRAIMVSRQGLLPAVHIEQMSTAWVSDVPDGPLTADGVARFVWAQAEAARASGVDWRAVVDGLRPQTQGIWLRLSADERRRFLAVHARTWEIRRHRMAPGVGARIDDYRAEGRLEVVAGGVIRAGSAGRRAELEIPGLGRVVADAVVNCTGPQTDIARSEDPLLRSMLAQGLIRPDPLRLGLDVTPDGSVLDESGAAVAGLYAVGPPRKGSLYESTAVPEIRTQAAQIAARLLSSRR